MKYDFGGYASKNDLKCSDGRIIRQNAFKDCDGQRVPLVYQHVHQVPTNIIGHADLENREDGVYAYCSFNNTESGKHMKEVVRHGDVHSLSIFANRLKQQGSDVLHGVIREVSVVLAGANPGAVIENVSFSHGDGFEYESDEDIILSNVAPIELAHSDNEDEEIEEGQEEISHADEEDQNGSSKDDKTIGDVLESMNEDQLKLVDYMMEVAASGEIEELSETTETVEHAEDDGPTVQDIWDSMTPEQQEVANYLVGKMMEEDDEEEIEVEEDEEVLEQSEDYLEGSDSLMYKNIFSKNAKAKEAVALCHDDMVEIVKNAKSGAFGGSFKENAIDYIQHNFELDMETDPLEALQHGIESLGVLFPEAKAVTNAPELVSRDMGWVSEVLNGVKKSPFARIKSTSADITADEARARGYIKGKKKIEEVVSLAKRVTTPQTVYKLQKLDRDDLIDATELDVVAWLMNEMKMMLDEEIARAALIGDGREVTDESKIKEENIRPVWKDDDFYTIHYDVTIPADGTRLEKSDAIVDAAIEARTDYMGSGSPVMFAPIETINMALLARDKVGHRLYANETDLASAMRVSKIIEVPVMSNITRTDDDENVHELLGLIVNLKDYTIGADKGGEVTKFDDFDLNYNKYEYLLETRCSGALTKPYSAIALEKLVIEEEEEEEDSGSPENPPIQG